jgi:hypothetical protein
MLRVIFLNIRFSLMILGCLGAFSAQAFDWAPDLKWGLNGRTYPIGLQAFGAAGIGLPLWGSTDQWKYGYLRLGANLASSAVVNRAGYELQLFPISILGLSYGWDTGTRNYTPKFINCSIYECNGRVDRSFWKGHFIAAYQGVIFSVTGRYEKLESFRSSKPFFDELTLLSGQSAGEHLLTLNPLLLYKWDETWKFGWLSIYAHALNSGGHSHLYGPMVAWSNPDRVNVAGGIGINESSLIHSAISAFFTIQFTLEPSLAVADMIQREKIYSSLF